MDFAAELIRHEGLDYRAFIAHLSRILPAKTYFEIGTAGGDSIAEVVCESIAVDPSFALTRNVVGRKPACHLFQMTSDAFFEQIDPTVYLRQPIDLAFLDGLHHFEVLLRDFMNTERNCTPDSLILLHDCLPPTFEMTTRRINCQGDDEKSMDPRYRGYWTGDVWKTAAILLEHRPELRMAFVDSFPTGLVLCTGLNPESSILSDGYQDIISKFAESDSDRQRLVEFYGSISVTSASALLKESDFLARILADRGQRRSAAPGADEPGRSKSDDPGFAPKNAMDEGLRILGGVGEDRPVGSEADVALLLAKEVVELNEQVTRLRADNGASRLARSTTEELTKLLIDDSKPHGVVWLAAHVPDWLFNLDSRLLIFHPSSPEGLRPGDIWVKHGLGPIDQGVVSGVWPKIEQHRADFEVAFLDGDHGLAGLRSQLSFLATLNPYTLVALDDAIPPQMDMTGPAQVGDRWWVGEVWAMIGWLKRVQPSLRSVVVEAEPAGFAVLSNLNNRILEGMDPEQVRREFVGIDSVAGIRSVLSVSHPSELLEVTRKWAFEPVLGPRLQFCELSELQADPSVEARLIDPKRPFVRAKADIVVDLSRVGVQHYLDQPLTTETPCKLWAGASGVTVRGAVLLELSGGRLFFPRVASGESTRAWADAIRRSALARQPDEFHSGLRWIGNAMVLEDRKTIEVDGDVVWATPDEHVNWGMWLLQTLPTLMQANAAHFAGSLLCYAAHPWQRDFLAMFAPVLSEKLIEQDLDCAYRIGGKLWVLAQDHRNFILTDSDHENLEKIIDYALSHTARSTFPEKLFVSRESRSQANPHYRALLNEAELIEALQDEGFEIIEPELLSFVDQIALFARALYVVGLGGAGMFNTMFCRPGVSVFTIESSNLWVHSHASIFASRGLKYSVAFGKQLQRDKPPHQRWTIPVEEIMMHIRNQSP